MTLIANSHKSKPSTFSSSRLELKPVTFWRLLLKGAAQMMPRLIMHQARLNLFNGHPFNPSFFMSFRTIPLLCDSLVFALHAFLCNWSSFPSLTQIVRPGLGNDLMRVHRRYPIQTHTDPTCWDIFGVS